MRPGMGSFVNVSTGLAEKNGLRSTLLATKTVIIQFNSTLTLITAAMGTTALKSFKDEIAVNRECLASCEVVLFYNVTKDS